MAQGGGNSSLTSLELSVGDIGRFVPRATEYYAWVVNGVTSTTLTYMKADEAAMVTVTPADSDADTAGHQISLSEGENAVSVTVSASGSETVYQITVTQHPAGAFEWDETRDFNVEEMHDLAEPWGIWSDGETMWVLDRADNKIHAFDFDTRARRQGRTISTLTAGSGTPHGLWSDGRTIWTADRHDDRLYAFDLATGAVRTDLGFAVRSRIVVAGPEGLWSDGDTVWVSQLKSLIDPERLYAWDLATGERRSRHDIIDHSLVSSGFRNVWSDGETMWAVVRGIDYNGIFAYDLDTGGAPE